MQAIYGAASTDWEPKRVLAVTARNPAGHAEGTIWLGDR